MASAIRKILLKKGINAAGKSGLGFTFDERDNKFELFFIRTIIDEMNFQHLSNC